MYKRGKKIFDTVFPGTNITYREKLIELVNQGKTGKQISKEMSIDYSNMHRWLRKLGLNLPNYHNELKFDNTVFDTIDTEEKAYWLGFMYADGYVQTNGNSVELSLKGSDREHLEKFRQFLHNKNEVKMGKVKCGDKEFSRCRLNMRDRHFHDSLVSKGCIPKKSLILTFPDKSVFSSEDLIIHFIRGYVDGDGCVSRDSSKYSNFEILGTLEFLTVLKKYCKNIFTKAFLKGKNTNSNTYFISVSGKKAAIFGDMLYKNATIYLQRKYNKFIENKYDEREHVRRMRSFSEKQQLYFDRGGNWNWQNFH